MSTDRTHEEWLALLDPKKTNAVEQLTSKEYHNALNVLLSGLDYDQTPAA